MKILFITLSPINSNSSATIRNKALIYGFIQNGHDVHVLSVHAPQNNPYFNSLELDSKFGVQIILNHKQIINSNNESPSKKEKNKILKSALRKVFHKFSIHDRSIIYTKNVRTIIKNLQLRSEYDLIISSSDPKTSHVLARKLINNGLKCKKWIQYWGDPLAIDITNKTVYPEYLLKFFERKIISNADSIVYVSPLTLKVQKELYKDLQHKMHFLPIPYIEEKLEDKIFTSNQLRISYFGDYISNIRNIKPLYNFVNNSEIENLKLTIAGNSDLQLDNSSNVEVFNRISSKELEIKESETDILVCILNLKGTQIPGKLYHYAASYKPILVIVDGFNQDEIINYLNSFSRFEICKNNEESIREAILKIKKENKVYTPLKDFNASAISTKFSDL